MKKLATILLTLTLLLSLGVTANAAKEPSTDPQVNVGSAGLKTEAAKPDISELFNTYYPEGLSYHESLQAEHESFHQERQAVKEATLAEKKAEKDAIKAAVEAGEMTRIEGLEALLELLKAQEPIRTELEAIKAAKQAEADIIKAERQALGQAMRTLLQEETIDEAAVASLLAEASDLLRAHIDMDYYYAEMVDDLVGIN